jgi:hypothetical protein
MLVIVYPQQPAYFQPPVAVLCRLMDLRTRFHALLNGTQCLPPLIVYHHRHNSADLCASEQDMFVARGTSLNSDRGIE